jgi:ligand-binding sensor domain-containing protein/signal transduction histidine kinase
MEHRFWLRRTTLLGLALLCLYNAAFGLDPNRRVSQYVHDVWGEEKGFLGGTIFAIGQSADGYLWIGTERGLVRFDGSNFTLIQRPITNEPRIGPVRGFATDEKGNLWIILEGPRMLLYHDGEFEDPYERFDLEGLMVTASTSDYEHRILVSGLGNSTLRFDNNEAHTIVKSQDSPGTVLSLAATRDGSVWLGTREHGLFRASQGSLAKMAPELSHSQIECLLPAVDGSLWIGTDKGLSILEGGAASPSRVPSLRNLRILSMTQDFDQNVWIGTNHGIVRITSSGAVSFDLLNPAVDDEVSAIYQDLDGDIWFSGPRGIEQLRNGMFTHYAAGDGLTSTSGGAIYIDSRNRTWFGPASGGLFLIDRGRAKSVTVAGLNQDVAYSISGGGEEIWIGRERGGLTVLTQSGNAFASRTYTQTEGLAQNNIYSVCRLQNGTVFAGTVSSGVSRFNRDRFTNFSDVDGLPSTSVNLIVQSSDGTTWIATPNGLASYINGYWKNYTTREGLPSPSVRAIFEDATHRIWIGGAGGLSYFSSGRIGIPDNLPDILREPIFGITEDSMGFLWFITSDRVTRVNRERLLSNSLQETDIQSFGVKDGLGRPEAIGRDRTIAVDRKGRVWLSLTSGLFMADPNVSKRNLAPVAVRVESVSAGARELVLEHPLRIPSGVQSITFNYGGTNLSSPDRIRFRYKLDGTGQDWSDIVASRQVLFSNLDPGSYAFRIVASNSIGLWNGPETTIPLVIEPAFWQTWWFRVVCLALLLSGLWATYLARLRHVTALLQLRHQERLSEREDIARDLHDTFFQAVQSLFLRLHTASRQLPEQDPTRQRLEEVLDDSDRVMMEGREMFLDIPQKESNKRDLPEVIAGYCEDFAGAHPTEYRVEVDGQVRSLDPLVAAELSKIAREAIYNAFRHANAKAIEVELTYGKREMRLRVRDSGQGFEPALVPKDSGHLHLGLANMRKRAEKLGADFRLWSRLGSGTELEVILPAQRAYLSLREPWTLFGSRREP